MPTYEFTCPNGHEFEKFFRSIGSAASEVACPTCGEIAERHLSAGAGLIFKGSGFYITDYGKDGKKDQRDAAASKSKVANADDAKAADSPAAGSGDSKQSDSSASESKPGESGGGSSAHESSSGGAASSSDKATAASTVAEPAPKAKPAPPKSTE